MQYRYLGRDGAHFIVRVENWHLVGQMWPANMLCLPDNVFLSAWISRQHLKKKKWRYFLSLSFIYSYKKLHTIFFSKVRISRNTGPRFPGAKSKSSWPHLPGHWSFPVCNVPPSFLSYMYLSSQAPIGV